MTADAWLLILVVGGLLALIPAWIASHKGQSFAAWWLFGLVLWIVAFPLSILVPDRRRRCPYCAEPVQAAAHVCPHCQREINAGPPVGISTSSRRFSRETEQPVPPPFEPVE